MLVTTLRCTSCIAVLSLLPGADLSGQNESVHAHLGYVATAFNETPGGRGLLPTAVAEAEVVRQHVQLAGEDSTAIEGIKRHVGHVLHAIDPSLVRSGPGNGYGLRQAAAGVLLHIQLAAEAEEVSDNVTTHATHVTSCVSDAISRTDAILELSREIQETNSAARVIELLAQLDAQSSALVSGVDVDGDGRIGWQAGEGGLRQATQHMTLMMRGEGLANR